MLAPARHPSRSTRSRCSRVTSPLPLLLEDGPKELGRPTCFSPALAPRAGLQCRPCPLACGYREYAPGSAVVRTAAPGRVSLLGSACASVPGPLHGQTLVRVGIPHSARQGAGGCPLKLSISVLFSLGWLPIPLRSYCIWGHTTPFCLYSSRNLRLIFPTFLVAHIIQMSLNPEHGSWQLFILQLLCISSCREAWGICGGCEGFSVYVLGREEANRSHHKRESGHCHNRSVG